MKDILIFIAVVFAAERHYNLSPQDEADGVTFRPLLEHEWPLASAGRASV